MRPRNATHPAGRRRHVTQVMPKRAKNLALALALAVAALAPFAVRAEPYIAQREGYKCSKCHVNRTGGGKRTDFGYQYALTHLRTFSSPPDADAPLPGAWRTIDPRPTDSLGLGMNARLSYARVQANEVQDGFESREANLYVEANLSPNLSLYLDTSVAQGSVESREAFIAVAGGPFSLKAGYLLLPYGLRIWGDQEFVRRETGFTFATPDLGVEVGYERGAFGAYVAASNGSGGPEVDEYKKVSATSELTFRAFRVGLSGSVNESRSRAVRMAGPHLGVTLGRLVVLAEADLIATEFKANAATIDSLAGYVEAAFLVRRGLTVRAAYGLHDPDLDQQQDRRLNVRAGVDFYPVPLLGLALHYNVGQSVPQDEVGNADTATAEIHVFF